MTASPSGEPAKEPPRTISRRTVVTAGVWAAPALVLATAVPARAASGDADFTAEVLFAQSPPATVEGQQGQIFIGFGFYWNAANWYDNAPPEPIAPPTVLTLTWVAEAEDVAGNVTQIASQTWDLVEDVTQGGEFTGTGFAPGTYTVRLRSALITFTPNPSAGETYAALPFLEITPGVIVT